MCTATSNDLGKITSGDEIWSWKIQKLISIFSETVKDRVIIFLLMIDLSKKPSRILIYLAIRRKTYSLLATRTFLVIIIIIIILFPFFVRAISQRWQDRFSWNFQGWCIISIPREVFSICQKFTSGRQIWPIFCF